MLTGVAAQAQDAPTIAILRFGGLPGTFTLTETIVMDVLQSYGFISAGERETLASRNDIQGENVNITWGDAGWDLPRANLMVEKALDQEADVLVTLTTPVTQVALNATLDLDYPPAILFASVYHPAQAGIAQSTCIKPDHVTGAHLVPPYEDIIKLITRLDPSIETVGTIFNSSETSGATGVGIMAKLGKDAGLKVLWAADAELSGYGSCRRRASQPR